MTNDRRGRLVKILMTPLGAAALGWGCGPIVKRQTQLDDVLAGDQLETEYLSSYEGYSLERLRDEYFAEMFIYRGINSEQPSGVSGGTARVTKDLLFWFESDRTNDAIEAARELIPLTLALLTNNTLSARIVVSSSEPADDDAMAVKVSFDETAGGGGHATFLENAQGEIESATIGLLSSFKVIEDRTELQNFRYVLRHEIGHILAATYHSGMSANIMSYNRTLASSTNYQDYEIAAFQLLYDLEPGTTLDSLLTSKVINSEHLDITPRVLAIYDMTDRSLPANTVKAGHVISFSGERFNFKWGCSDTDFAFPAIVIGETPLTIEGYNTQMSGINGFNCVILNARVPEGATSGNLVLTTEYQKSTEPVFVTVQ